MGVGEKWEKQSKRNRLHHNNLGLAIAASVAMLIFAAVVTGHIDSVLASDNNEVPPSGEHPLQKVKVGDIEMSYRTFGKGEPLLLVHGFGGSMDVWDPTLLQLLAENHTVIVLNNRGVGNTTLGERQYSISQLANDASGLLDALGMEKADVLGWSMGGMIAQELAVNHPEKVNRLILYATSCGGEEGFVPPEEDALNAFADRSGTAEQRLARLLPYLFTEEWIASHSDYWAAMPRNAQISSNNTLNLEQDAGFSWKGVCNQLGQFSGPTLVITGRADQMIPPANSIAITERTPGAWLIQLDNGGHGMMYQYPEKMGKLIQTFLDTT
jgi:pimeloyl-ACP methyl ester carboxylesterase